MIYGLIQGQKLIVKTPVIASGTRDYLTAHFDFSEDWNGAEKFVYFNQGEKAWRIRLDKDNNITKDKHLNLSEGSWDICIVGEIKETVITTIPATITVNKSCVEGEESFPIEPPSLGQQILDTANEAKETAEKVRQDAENGVFNKGTTFIYRQKVPDNIWVIQHNLNKNPSVTVVDSANTVVIGDIKYLSKDELSITFAGEFGGTAYLN